MSGYTLGSWVNTQAGDDLDKDFVSLALNSEGDVQWGFQVKTEDK